MQVEVYRNGRTASVDLAVVETQKRNNDLSAALLKAVHADLDADNVAHEVLQMGFSVKPVIPEGANAEGLKAVFEDFAPLVTRASAKWAVANGHKLVVENDNLSYQGEREFKDNLVQFPAAPAAA